MKTTSSIDYASYMRSPAWHKLRRQVIRRGNGVCERFGKWPVVNAHHLTYIRLGRELLSDLQGVCSKCHEELHHDS